MAKKCFYHSADLDGHCSGALVKMAYPGCAMFGIDYGEEFPWDKIDKDDEVYMVDFSLQPFKLMEKLNKACNLIWIDHHISAIKEERKSKSVIEGLRRDGIGACQLTWEYVTKGKSSTEVIPTFIKLLAQYDVWDHSNPQTLPFQYGMRLQDDTTPTNTDFWYELFDVEFVNRLTKDGGLILQYAKKKNESYVKACSFTTNLDGLTCLACNLMLTDSKLFDSIWNPKKYDAMLTFGWKKNIWTVSLYTDKEGVDVSKVAKARGGGGHKGAAGFQCEELPFDLKVK